MKRKRFALHVGLPSNLLMSGVHEVIHKFKSRTMHSAAIVFSLAFLIRLVYLAGYLKSPFAQVPLIDARFYHDWALQILSGDILSLQQGSILYKPPLYAYFLAGIYAAFGKNLLAVRSLSIVLRHFLVFV